jgi:hypothetical protein
MGDPVIWHGVTRSFGTGPAIGAEMAIGTDPAIGTHPGHRHGACYLHSIRPIRRPASVRPTANSASR